MPKTKVELYAAIRRDARMEHLSVRALALKYKVHRRTVRDALKSAWSTPRKKMAPRKSVLDSFKTAIDQMLRADLDAPRKQRHTSKRIFDRPPMRSMGRRASMLICGRSTVSGWAASGWPG
ncbi:MULTISPECIES: hypothetical protein [Nonomuraea]|uniref:Transposase n=1 Tax=Nonomuraea mangrovi TaxID=2316207 RepID=A0ABW4SRH8_9ACTN